MSSTSRLAYESLVAAAGPGHGMKDDSAPSKQYHRVDHWFQPDVHNGCTTSGCHSVLPHTKHVETRAFANAHAQFMDCGLCHAADLEDPVRAIWVSTDTGMPQEIPPVLRLIRYLEKEEERIVQKPGEINRTILKLLGDTLAAADGQTVLLHLYRWIDTSEPGSPVWVKAVEQLTKELPLHERGEYGAKLARFGTATDKQEARRRLRQEAGSYLGAPPGSKERDRMYQESHANVLGKPVACSKCHGGEPARLGFESLGYSAERTAVLRDSIIAEQMQRIREGVPFHLPNITGRF